MIYLITLLSTREAHVNKNPSFTGVFIGATGDDSNPRPRKAAFLAKNSVGAERVSLAFSFCWGPEGVTDAPSYTLVDSDHVLGACGKGGER